MNYRGIGNLHFLIEVPGGYQISLILTATLTNGLVTIKSGLGKTDEIIQTLHATVLSRKIVTTYSKVYIIFSSKEFVANRFEAVYTTSKGNKLHLV